MQKQSSISDGHRIAELDGLRGLAAIVVVVAHYFGEVPHGVPLWFGAMGVNLFFVLSGFLIGSIILERKDSANFFQVFYIRRACRILPVYFGTLALVFAFLWWRGDAAWIAKPLPAESYATFTQNIVMAANGVYGSPWLLPTWTLAVEEQFYLIIPLLLAFMAHRLILPAILSGVAVGVGVRGAFYWSGNEIAGQVLLVSRADILLCGVLVAYLHRHHAIPERILRMIRLACVFAFVALAINWRITERSIVSPVLSPLLIAGMFSTYVLSAVHGSETLRVFRGRGWVWFGSISYCLYLIHQPVAGILQGVILGGIPDINSTSKLAVTVAAVVVSVGLATLSMRFVEQPLQRFGRAWTYSRFIPRAAVI